MAKLEFKGLDEYIKQLNALEKNTTPMLKQAVYAGADIVADEIKKAIKELDNIDPKRKQGLIDGLGIARIKNENGVVNTKIGFDGYNSRITVKFPKGEPNALIARSIVKGVKGRPKKSSGNGSEKKPSTGRKKNDFIKKAVNKAKPVAEKKMVEITDAAILKKINEFEERNKNNG